MCAPIWHPILVFHQAVGLALLAKLRLSVSEGNWAGIN